MSVSSSMSTKNWDRERPKKSEIQTPLRIARFLAEEVLKRNRVARVIDVGCHKGNLSKPYSEKEIPCVGIDAVRRKYHGDFVKRDFLALENEVVPKKNDLVVCNPPFNSGGMNQNHKRKLLPELFFDRMLSLWQKRLRLVMFAPMGFRLNQRKRSTRFRKLRDCGCPIAAICSIPLDSFKKVQFHAEVLFFNLVMENAHFFLPEHVL